MPKQRDDKSTRYLVLQKEERVFEVDLVAAVAPSVRSDCVCPELMYQTIENVILGGSRCYC